MNVERIRESVSIFVGGWDSNRARGGPRRWQRPWLSAGVTCLWVMGGVLTHDMGLVLHSLARAYKEV